MAKFCTNCGNKMEDHHNACSQCGMMYQSTMTGTQAMPNNYQQMPNGAYYNPQYQPYGQQMMQQQEEQVGYAWVVLGFVIPIAGWIIWGIWNNTKPKTAKYAGIAGIIGFVLNLILLSI